MTSAHGRRLAAWLAIFAMMLAAFAPTVSRALARGSVSPGSWAEVCTASGVQWVKLGNTATTDSVGSAVSGEPASGQPAHNPLDHCPLCLLAADRLGPPSSPPTPFGLHGDPLAIAIHQEPLLHAFSPLAAHARGPPRNPSPLSVA